MYNGGPVTLIYGFIFCWISALTTAASLAEMASMAPTSGGQYHWVSMLAPRRYSIFLSWITGWFANTRLDCKPYSWGVVQWNNDTRTFCPQLPIVRL